MICIKQKHIFMNFSKSNWIYDKLFSFETNFHGMILDLRS
jgi:hypothetical protein